MHPTKESLISLIDWGREGKVVLPHFQRSFIWDRQSIEELLVSILNDYFVASFWAVRVARLRAVNRHPRPTQCR